VVMIFVGDWLHEDVGKRWVATPAQGDQLILSTYNIEISITGGVVETEDVITCT